MQAIRVVWLTLMVRVYFWNDSKINMVEYFKTLHSCTNMLFELNVFASMLFNKRGYLTVQCILMLPQKKPVTMLQQLLHTQFPNRYVMQYSLFNLFYNNYVM